jgi:hypothetical protein
MALKRRSVSPTGSSQDSLPCDAGEWGKKYPTLTEFLTLRIWEDGAARLCGTVLLFVDLGTWKACLHDKDAAASSFVSAKTPGELLTAVEKGLVGDTLDWRADRPIKRPGAR